MTNDKLWFIVSESRTEQMWFPHWCYIFYFFFFKQSTIWSTLIWVFFGGSDLNKCLIPFWHAFILKDWKNEGKDWVSSLCHSSLHVLKVLGQQECCNLFVHCLFFIWSGWGCWVDFNGTICFVLYKFNTQTTPDLLEHVSNLHFFCV